MFYAAALPNPQAKLQRSFTPEVTKRVTMLCRVKFSATLEEHSIHVEEFGHPDALLFASEGDSPGPVAHQAWDRYMRNHPENSTRALHLHLQGALPPARLNQVARAFVWLLRQIVIQKGGTP
jgi:hypothetical protein